MDKKLKPFTRVGLDLQRLGLMGQEGYDTFLEILEGVGKPMTDIQAELQEAPRLRACVGYLYRTAEQAAKEAEDQVEHSLLRTYHTLHSAKYKDPTVGGKLLPVMSVAGGKLDRDPVGKFTEKLVLAQALQEPAFVALKERADSMRAAADKLYELKEAVIARLRALDQFSNNARFLAKHADQEDSE